MCTKPPCGFYHPIFLIKFTTESLKLQTKLYRWEHNIGSQCEAEIRSTSTPELLEWWGLLDHTIWMSIWPFCFCCRVKKEVMKSLFLIPRALHRHSLVYITALYKSISRHNTSKCALNAITLFRVREIFKLLEEVSSFLFLVQGIYSFHGKLSA